MEVLLVTKRNFHFTEKSFCNKAIPIPKNNQAEISFERLHGELNLQTSLKFSQNFKLQKQKKKISYCSDVLDLYHLMLH